MILKKLDFWLTLKIGPQIELQMHSKQIIAKYGHFANECIKLMKSLWLPAHAQKGGCISSIRIINGSQSPMRLGQADTDESILIKPGEILQYPWRSQKVLLTDTKRGTVLHLVTTVRF